MEYTCTSLASRAHAALCAFSERTDRRGCSKAGLDDVAQRIGARPQEIRDLLDDLGDFVTKVEHDTWRVQEPCRCPCAEILPSTRLKNQKTTTSAILSPSLRLVVRTAVTPSLRSVVPSPLPPTRGEDSGKSQENWNARDLVSYFYRVATPEIRAGLNAGALRSHFARWLRDGRSPPQIKKMIDQFVKNPGRMPVQAWRVFLTKQHDLSKIASDYRRNMEEHRYDPSYWAPQKANHHA